MEYACELVSYTRGSLVIMTVVSGRMKQHIVEFGSDCLYAQMGDEVLDAAHAILSGKNIDCTYLLENGALGTMTVSWTNYGTEDNSTRLYCTEGVIRMYDDPEASLIVEKRDGTVERFALDQLTSNKDQTGGKRTSTGVIDAFVDSLMNGKPSPISGESVIPAMKAVFANERSAKEGRMVDVE